MGIVGPDGLQFLSLNGFTVFGRKNDDRFTVPFFLRGLQISSLSNDPRSQIITKLPSTIKFGGKFHQFSLLKMNLRNSS